MKGQKKQDCENLIFIHSLNDNFSFLKCCEGLLCTCQVRFCSYPTLLFGIYTWSMDSPVPVYSAMIISSSPLSELLPYEPLSFSEW